MTLPDTKIPGGWQQMPTAVPVGSIMAFAGKVSPVINPGDPVPPVYPVDQSKNTTDTESQGWMVCNGRTLDTTAYGALYQVIGDQYNTGKEQQGQFSIPDYRGYFLRMIDLGSGNDPDSSKRVLENGTTSDDVGSLQQDALQDHDHKVNNPATPSAPAGQGATPSVVQVTPALSGPPTDSLTSTNGTIRVSTETRAKNIYVYYLIKFIP